MFVKSCYDSNQELKKREAVKPEDPPGIAEKACLTKVFVEIKRREYKKLQRELEQRDNDR